MVIILAGCDGTGKSTCFKLLKETIPGNFIKESYTSNVNDKAIRALFTDTKTHDKDLTVYDRATILDDLVYEEVMCNSRSELYTRIGIKKLKMILDKCVIIYFDLDNYVLTERLQQRKDDYVKVSQVNKIKWCYEKVFSEMKLDIKKIDITGLTEKQVYSQVRRIIENEELEDR